MARGRGGKFRIMLGLFSSSRARIKLPLRGVIARGCFRRFNPLGSGGSETPNPALKLIQDPNQVLLALSNNPQMKTNVKAYTQLITSLSTIQPTRALELFHEMQQVGIPPNITTFNALFAMAKKTNDANLAASLLEKMLPNRVDPNSQSYTTLIELFASKLEETKAMAFFEEMKARKIHPNIRIYSTLIDMFSSLEGGQEKGRQLFKEMNEKNLIRPANMDVINLSILIDIYCKLNQPEDALNILRQMEKRKMLPHARTYNQLIFASNTKQAFELAEEMQTKGIPCSPPLYKHLLRVALRSGDTKKALELFHKIPQEKPPPWYLSLKESPFLDALIYHDAPRALRYLAEAKDTDTTLRE